MSNILKSKNKETAVLTFLLEQIKEIELAIKLTDKLEKHQSRELKKELLKFVNCLE